MFHNKMFDYRFNAGYSWSEASKKDPEIRSSLEKEARVWKMMASINAASSTGMAASSATASSTATDTKTPIPDSEQ